MFCHCLRVSGLLRALRTGSFLTPGWIYSVLCVRVLRADLFQISKIIDFGWDFTAELATGKHHLKEGQKLFIYTENIQAVLRALPHDVLYYNVHYSFLFLLLCTDTDIFTISYSKQCFRSVIQLRECRMWFITVSCSKGSHMHRRLPTTMTAKYHSFYLVIVSENTEVPFAFLREIICMWSAALEQVHTDPRCYICQSEMPQWLSSVCIYSSRRIHLWMISCSKPGIRSCIT